MTNWEVGDKAEILQDFESSCAPNGVFKKGEFHTVNFVGAGGCITFEGDYSRRGWSNEDSWFRKIEPHEAIAAPKTTLSGGLNNYYIADVPEPQRGGPGYRAEADDIIFVMRMTFDEGEAFKAIWRSCAARLGNGKPGSDAVYDAEKIVHRGGRILKRAKLDAQEKENG